MHHVPALVLRPGGERDSVHACASSAGGLRWPLTRCLQKDGHVGKWQSPSCWDAYLPVEFLAKCQWHLCVQANIFQPSGINSQVIGFSPVLITNSEHTSTSHPLQNSYINAVAALLIWNSCVWVWHRGNFTVGIVRLLLIHLDINFFNWVLLRRLSSMSTSAEMVEKALYNEQDGMLGSQIWDVCLKFACRPVVGMVLRAVVCDGY